MVVATVARAIRLDRPQAPREQRLVRVLVKAAQHERDRRERRRADGHEVGDDPQAAAEQSEAITSNQTQRRGEAANRSKQ